MTEHAFGSYIPRHSVVHETKAQVKIVLVCAFSIGVFFIRTWAGLGIAAGVLACLYAVARVPMTRALKGLAPVLFILVFTVAVHALSLTLEGLAGGLFIAVRIAELVFACMLVTFTTAPVALTDGLGRLLGPCRRLRVPVDDLAVVISLALRFIPLVVEEASAVRKAQMARGADFETGSLLAKTKAWTLVLVPLIVRMFRRADETARAMEARCYGRGPRTQLDNASMRVGDWCGLVGGLAAIAALCILL